MLANLTRWVATDRVPISIDGPGFLHCQLYRQEGRLILHIVNLTGFEVGGTPVHEHFPVGPLRVQVQIDRAATSVHALVSGLDLESTVSDGTASFGIARIVDHEVIVIDIPSP